jgi:hypothetical protein
MLMQYTAHQKFSLGQHLHKAIEPPIIIHQTVTDVPLPPFFGELALLLLAAAQDFFDRSNIRVPSLEQVFARRIYRGRHARELSGSHDRLLLMCRPIGAEMPELP